MYLSWNEKTITEFSDKNIESAYHDGYLFTRTGKGGMIQTRSVRIDLALFALSSENRRILKKTESITSSLFPLPYSLYNWRIGKMAKDFYEQKFGAGTFSANKIKELMTDPAKSNFNKLFIYEINGETIGYAIALETKAIIHYAYPFYQLKANSYKLTANTGMGMMLRAIISTKEQNKKYIYLGSAQRQSDTYKLQFHGIEWYNGSQWETDLGSLKQILQTI